MKKENKEKKDKFKILKISTCETCCLVLGLIFILIWFVAVLPGYLTPYKKCFMSPPKDTSLFILLFTIT